MPIYVHSADLFYLGDDTSRLLHRGDYAVKVMRTVPRIAVCVVVIDHDVLAVSQLAAVDSVLSGHGCLRHTGVCRSLSASLLLLCDVAGEQAHGDSIEEPIGIGRSR